MFSEPKDDDMSITIYSMYKYPVTNTRDNKCRLNDA